MNSDDTHIAPPPVPQAPNLGDFAVPDGRGEADINPSVEVETGFSARELDEPDYVAGLKGSDPMNTETIGEMEPRVLGEVGGHAGSEDLADKIAIGFHTKGVYLVNQKTKVVHAFCQEMATHTDAVVISGRAARALGRKDALVFDEIEKLADANGVLREVQRQLETFRQDFYFDAEESAAEDTSAGASASLGQAAHPFGDFTAVV